MSSNYFRLDVTSRAETFVQVAGLLSLGLAGAGIFCVTVVALQGHGDFSLPLLATAVGGVLFFLFSLIASMQDDTYLLHFPTRQLMYQQRGPFGARMRAIKSFDQIRAVGVTYLQLREKSGSKHRYCLVMVCEDGTQIRVSDWREDGYADVSQRAWKVGPMGPWPVLDQGEFRAIEVQVAQDGRRWATQVDRSWWVSAQALLGLVTFLILAFQQLWVMFHSIR